jgi:hypothetical protein
VQHHAVDRFGHAMRAGTPDEDAAEDRFRPGSAIDGAFGGPQMGAAPALGVCEQAAQGVEPQALVAHHGAHRNAECALESLQVDRAASRVQLVGHGDDQAGGRVALQHLGGEEQGALEGAGVDDDHQGLGRLRDLAVEDAAHDPFVGADRVHAVGTGQVDDDQAPAVHRDVALAPFDRDARVVADLGPQPGQRVEQRRLSRVRAPEQAHAKRRFEDGLAHRGQTGAESGDRTWIHVASLCRRQMR